MFLIPHTDTTYRTASLGRAMPNFPALKIDYFYVVFVLYLRCKMKWRYVMVKLKIPAKAAEPAVAPQVAVQPEEPHQPAQVKGSTARFIRQGDSRPVRRTLPTNFRLPADIIDMLEEEALQTGQNKTTILKAAILAYCTSMDQNEKNRWLLEAPRY